MIAYQETVARLEEDGSSAGALLENVDVKTCMIFSVSLCL